MSAVVISSCSKDEDNSTSPTSKIVGKWKYSWDDGFGLLTFKADGSGTYFEYDNGDIDSDNEPFYYTYDNDTNMLTIMWLEDGQIVKTKRELIKWINDNTFTCNLMDNGSLWKRQ